MKGRHQLRLAKTVRLYNELSANLALYDSGLQGKVVCPLCLGICDTPEQLTVAHVFPKSLGGRMTTLACPECNSFIGREIEAYEINRAKANRAFLGTGSDSIRVNLRPRGPHGDVGHIAADMTVIGKDEDRCYQLVAAQDGSNPSAIKGLDELFRSGSIDWEIGLKYTSNSGWNRARLTYLHSAYMKMFQAFGYEWVCEPSAAVIREQLSRPEENLIAVPIIKLGAVMEGAQPFSIVLVTMPEEMRGFFIVMPELDYLESHVVVWLPLFGQPYNPPDNPSGNIQSKICDAAIPPLSSKESRWFGHRLVKHVLG